MVNSAHLSIMANQFCFETGCFVYHLNVLEAESFKFEHCCELNKVTKHKLAGIKPLTCML